MGQEFAFGPFVFDPQRGTLTRDGLPVSIGCRGLSLLHALLRADGRVVCKAELMEAAWPATAIAESNLSVQVAGLRKLLGSSPTGRDWIVTVPRVGYRFTGLDAARNSETEDHRVHAAEAAARPMIAVLPLLNLSGDRRQEYLADGLTEDIITALARFRWFAVIARNSSFIYKGRAVEAKQIAHELGARYLLEGSVRKSGTRARISAQLIDAPAGTHIWAERYDLAFTDLFAIQDEIAERVAGAIEPELLKTESILAATRHTGNMSAWDLVRQGTWYFHQVSRPTHLRARELFREACQIDPHLPEAHIWRARVSAGLIAYGWSENSSDWQEGFDAALCAIDLDSRNPYSHYALAIISAYGDDVEQAVRAAEEAVELSPSFALGHLVSGMAHLFAGRAGDAIQPLEHGLQLSPHDPQNFVWMNLLALAHLFSGRSASALQVATKALKIRPVWRPLVETVGCCHAASGDWDQARRCVEQLARIEPPPGDALAPLKRWNPQWREWITHTLQKAGDGASAS